MTVSDPGAGQQQGRQGGCSPTCHCRKTYPAIVVYPAPSPTPPARDSGREGCTCDAPLSSCTPGCPCTSCNALRDSGRDEARERDTQLDTSVPFGEAREAVARWLAANTAHKDGDLWPRRGTLLGAADELLALPELDKLLRRPA